MSNTQKQAEMCSPMSGSRTVLVIDDEEPIRDSCCQVLARAGYRTYAADEGDTGLRKVAGIKPDLVLVDLKMPGMSGMELLEKIAEIDPGIVSVVITGYGTIESAVEAMKRNAYDLLPKPFTPDQLRIVVKRGLERRMLAVESERLRREKEMMRENFVTLVSHQLRSPLASIKQYFAVIAEGFAGNVTDKQKQIIAKAGKSLDDLMQLINDWLDMSRISSGRIADKFEPVAIGPVLSEIIEIEKPLADAEKIKLGLNLCNGTASICADRESLQQAITNIVCNAIHYTPHGGSVTVSTREQGGEVIVEVSDTGIGISKDDLPFIFEEFFRVKSSQTQHVTGSGLGLPITKRIIDAHNGRIKVDSELGKGTTFSIFLPKVQQ